MAANSADWLAGACCHNTHDTPGAPGTLPAEYRADIGRFGLVAIASSAFFIAAPLLLAPLPSRPMAGAVPVAHGGLITSPVMARASSVSTSPVMMRRERRRPRAPITIARVEPARFVTPAPSPERKRNVFSRFFRSLIRRPAPPVTVKAEPTL